MKNTLPIKLTIWIAAGVFLSILDTRTAWAQTAQDFYSLGIAEPTPVQGEAGQVISHIENQYQLSTIAYDSQTHGVIIENPAVEFSYTDQTLLTNTLPVLTQGTAPVQVSTQNGPINVGDRLTTSEIPGVAVKADKSGFTLGIAQEAYSADDPNQVGQIIATIDIRYTLADDPGETNVIRARLTDVLNLSAIAALEDPTDVFKYVLAAFILVGSIAFSFLVFGRSAQNSITALGRNPLASRAISLDMILNIIMSVIVIISGVATAWFVINL